MGQYYIFGNLTKKERCDRNRETWKLMEHSYVGNKYCDDILTLLSNKWKGDQVVHVGDYADDTDLTTTQNFIECVKIDNNVNNVYDWIYDFNDINVKPNNNIRYVYNHDKKEYVDLYEQPIQWFWINDNNKVINVKINSFALLIGCGNGQGGGDYFYNNKNRVGYWAGDHFESSASFLEKYNDYKKFNVYFDESLLLKSKKTSDFYKKDEKLIVNMEKKELSKFLLYLKSREYDFKKLSLDTKNMTDIEIKRLVPYFEKQKEKIIKLKEGYEK